MNAPKVLTSIHGRRLGLDKDGGLVTKDKERHPRNDFRQPTPVGVSTLSSDATVYTLTDPQPGQEKQIFSLSTSTDARYVKTDGASIQSTAGASFNTIAFSGIGAGAVLRGLSTALWQITANIGGTLSTST